MRWTPGHKSSDLIDRRGQGGGGGLGQMGSLFAFLPLLLRFRFGWVIILLAVGGWFFMNRVDTSGGTNTRSPGSSSVTPGAVDKDKEQVEFVSFVLDDAQSTWTKQFAANGKTYRNAKLVLFTNAMTTACGQGQSASGPFYCPADERVYIDLAFYKELAQRFGAKGDFAQAYVIAHEIGHHVQHQLGISDKVQRGAKSDRRGEDSAAVRLELQADCFAGVWAKSTAQKDLLEAGDLDEAITAAAAIGDDRLQKQATGRVQPESWTHGSSEQRMRWLKTGYDQGTMNACDTFGAKTL